MNTLNDEHLMYEHLMMKKQKHINKKMSEDKSKHHEHLFKQAEAHV